MLPFTATEGIQLQENTISNTWLPPPLLLQKVYNCNKPSVDIPGRRHHHHHHYNSRYSTARKCHFKYLASTITTTTTTTTTEGTQLQQNISWHTWPPPPPPLLQKVFNCNKTSVDIPGHHHHHHCYRRYSTATKHQLTYLATTTTTTATEGIQLQQNISWHTWPPPPPPLLQKVFNCNKTSVDIPGHHHHHCYRRYSTATKHQLTYLATTTTTTATEGIQLQQNISWHTWPPPPPPPPLLQKVFNCNKTSADIPGHHHHHHHHCYRRYSTATKHQLTYLTTTTTTATEGIQLQQNSWHTWPPLPPPPLLQKVFNCNKTSVDIPDHHHHHHCYRRYSTATKQLTYLATTTTTTTATEGIQLQQNISWHTWPPPPPPPAPLLQKVFNYNKTSVEIPGHRRCGRCSLCWWCCLLVVLAAAAPTSPCSAGCFLCSDGPGATWGMPSALHHVSLHLFEKVRWTIDKVSTESPLTDKKSERRTCTHLADSQKTVTRGTELDIYY